MPLGVLITMIDALQLLSEKIGAGSIQPDSVSHAHIVDVDEKNATADMPVGRYLLAEARFMLRLDD